MQTKLFTFLLFLFFSATFFSQEIPEIKAGKTIIAVKKLNVTVSVVGDVAITTYDMQFYNSKSIVLEGELSFPLGENQSVTRFALDINGNLREAVVVEKEKARIAFESTVRNRIDPALLEQTKGNNYKARVYPIPAKGYKRVVVAFQQKLLLNKDSYYYKIPFKFKNKLETFSLSIEVLNQKNKPISKKGMVKEFLYNADKDSYYVKVNKVKTNVTQPVLIQIPINTNKEKVLISENYFYFNKQLDIKPKNLVLENEITIFWDASLSQKNKKIASEVQFLDAYFKQVKDCNVNFVVFNIDVKTEKKYAVKNGDWYSLKQEIENVIYDGASSFHFLKNYKNTKLNLLFTDGLNTLSDMNLTLNNKTHIINSVISANHLRLKNAANVTGGKYVNLQQVSIKEGFGKILQAQIQFLGANFSSEELEVYPKKGSIITNNFSISGKGKYLNKNIEFYFGYGKDTLKSVSFLVKKNKIKNNFISKIWAQNKLNYLLINSEDNKEEIINFSKKHQIISPFTSMLILDRVEDYVIHSIEPPKELKEKYDELITQKINNKKDRISRLQEELFRKYEDFFKWNNTAYISTKNIENIANTPTTRNNNVNRITEVRQDTVIQSGEFFVSGIVSDTNGALPGVSVIIKGTTKGTQTDFDGKYKIKLKVGDELFFSYLGYKTLKKIVRNNNNLNIELEEDGSQLDEIVVVGYASRRTRSVTASVSRISAENISSALNGSVSGVQISGNTGATSNVVIRGATSIKNTNPLYVVDGELVEDYSEINPNKIQSIYTLNSDQSSSIYGSRGGNGVVVIVTKKGFEDDLEEIENFENLVKEKVELKGWNPKTPYLKILKKINNTPEVYSKYIALREKYSKSPSFYIDVADFFKSRNEYKTAIQILTNVAEIELDNYELLKALAYKFEEYKIYDYAVYIYKEIVLLRPEDIQSHRDLALAYGQVGEYQKSVDILYRIVNGELLEKDEVRRFSGIEIIALNELNKIITLHKKELVISHIPKKYITNTQADIKVLIDWNHNDTDIDLWVTDPKGEKCYYAHKKSKIGGLMSEDMTDGFGPEQFILKKAVKGNYKIQVKYYASNQQKISGPTFLKITTFKNYGFKNEIKKTRLVRLTKVSKVLNLGELVF